MCYTAIAAAATSIVDTMNLAYASTPTDKYTLKNIPANNKASTRK